MSAAAPVRAVPARAGAARVRPRGVPEQAPQRPKAATARPQLRVVAPTRLAAGPLPFAVLVSVVLGAGLVVLLMLHTLAAQDAFTVHKLQRQSAAMSDVEQELAVANEQAQAPSALAARAQALGMVPTGSLQVVRHRDGRIVAVASAVPVLVPAPTTSPTAATGSAGAAGPASGSTAPSASATPHPTRSAAATKPAKRRHPH